MKSFIAVVAVVLAVLATTASAKSVGSHFADKDFLVKQKFIFEVLQHVYQDDVFVTKYDDSFYSYLPWEHFDDFHHTGDAKEQLEQFFDLWQHKPMHDDEIFSVMYERHEEYASGLTRLFYFAKDWNTFMHTVFWARLHVNKHLFVYSLTVASLFRKDLTGVVFPAIYEILPNYFFEVDTLEVAKRYKMHGFHNVKQLDNVYNAVIKSNYSNGYVGVNNDHSLAYFLEDIGLNAFYYYFNIDYPAWTSGPDDQKLNNDRRGEFWLYVHWQLLARYNLELLSMDMAEAKFFDPYKPIPIGYVSNLQYYTGTAFPERPYDYSFYHDENFEYIRNLETYGSRLTDLIDRTPKFTTEQVNILGNIIQGNTDSVDGQYYGSLDKYYRYTVNDGRYYGKYLEGLPTTFMHYETSLRDPLFFDIFKTIISYYWRLMEKYPEYTRKDFVFDDVKIDQVHLPDHFTTYFEYFDADISNAVHVEVPNEGNNDPLYKFGRNSHHDGHSFVIKARQYRLNHKPFEFTLDVTSDADKKAVVKVFIGPKYDADGVVYTLEDCYKNFYELEHFTVDLVAGVNHIKRSSNDFTWYVDDRTTYFELYQKIMDATNTDYKFPLDQTEAHCGVPRRLMLPRGKRDGLIYQMFFMVYPFHASPVEQYAGFDPTLSCGVGSGARFIDALPFGFPFNRPVYHHYHFDVDNFHFQDVKIFHKDDSANVVA